MSSPPRLGKGTGAKRLVTPAGFLLVRRASLSTALQPLRRERGCAARILCAVAMLALALSASADKVYTVRRYDTLSAVARQNGLSPSELAAYNKLPANTRLKVGQKLRIPTHDDDAGKKSAAKLPPKLVAAIEDAPVAAGRWKYVVVHHSGTADGTVRGMDQYHREVRHMENGLAYHFVIGNGHGMGDGEIAAGRRWTEQLDGGHLASESLNHVAIGICLVGNFEKQPPTAKQRRSLEWLIQALLKRCHLPRSAVKAHQQINPIYTICPGRLFPRKALSGEP